MDKERVTRELQARYPDKDIFLLPLEDPKEIICEVEPSKDHPDFSKAVAVIERSEPHVHHKSWERYEVMEGKVVLYMGHQRRVLHKSQSVVIWPGTNHWAESVNSEEAWVMVDSSPGWTTEDHILTRNHEE